MAAVGAAFSVFCILIDGMVVLQDSRLLLECFPLAKVCTPPFFPQNNSSIFITK
jgi:hypothetical protein